MAKLRFSFAVPLRDIIVLILKCLENETLVNYESYQDTIYNSTIHINLDMTNQQEGLYLNKT